MEVSLLLNVHNKLVSSVAFPEFGDSNELMDDPLLANLMDKWNKMKQLSATSSLSQILLLLQHGNKG